MGSNSSESSASSPSITSPRSDDPTSQHLSVPSPPSTPPSPPAPTADSSSTSSPPTPPPLLSPPPPSSVPNNPSPAPPAQASTTRNPNVGWPPPPPPMSVRPPPPPISPPSSDSTQQPPLSPSGERGTSSSPPTHKSSASFIELHPYSSYGNGLLSSQNDAGFNKATLALGMVFGIILVVVIGGAVLCVLRQRRKGTRHRGVYIMTHAGSYHDSDPVLMKMQMSPFRIGSGLQTAGAYSPSDAGRFFGYEELFEATGGFSSQNLLGEGGFGSVYKGNLLDGRAVAVKQLKVGGQQGEREFSAEVNIITRIHHRHLVSLVGYCIHEKRRLLVYDYVPNNTLYFHLHGEGAPVLGWDKRVKIAIGAARGIAYLHEDCHPRIIHRDIKSSNILLDNNFDARVSDFGLAKLTDANSHVITRVVGTFGYMAPEYASTGKLTDKSDIYSFGVVLLELVTGRKPVDSSQPQGYDGLVEWARPLLSKALETKDVKPLADPMLQGNYDPAEMLKMVEVAAASVRHAYANRPRMVQIVRALDVMANSDLMNGVKVGESEIFSVQQSSEYRLLRKMAFENQVLNSEFFNRSNSISEMNQPTSR